MGPIIGHSGIAGQRSTLLYKVVGYLTAVERDGHSGEDGQYVGEALLQRIEKPNLRANVVKQVQDLVRSGQLGPEARLPSERELQRQLNVSRPLLREALHELTLTGLIEARHGRGWFISDTARSRLLSRPLSQYLLHGEISISELLQTRILIEGEAARLAATAASPSDIVDLQHMLRAIEGARDQGDEHVQLDTAFHTRIASIAGNRLLVRLLDSMQDLLTEYRHMLLVSVPDRMDAANEEHRRIVAAIARHESDTAAAEMRAHIEAIGAEVTRRSWRPVQEQEADALWDHLD